MGKSKIKFKNARLLESQYSIEQRYEKLIGLKIEQMKDKTMGELWTELDVLKRKLKNDLKRNGHRV
jgi:hypothetical protein